MNMDKNRPDFKTIDEYIAAQAPETREVLQKLREVIHEAVPEATEKISYQMPTFYLNGNLVHFAVFKKHYGFYPTSSGAEAFKEELSAYESSIGSVQFPKNKPVPYDLVKRITIYRAEHNRNLPKRK